jgi:hypothetical protein
MWRAGLDSAENDHLWGTDPSRPIRHHPTDLSQCGRRANEASVNCSVNRQVSAAAVLERKHSAFLELNSGDLSSL